VIAPAYLKEGDTIALIAASRFIEQNMLERAVTFFKQFNFQVICGPHILSKNHQFAGTDQERAQDLNWALENEEVKAIVFFRGGYGAAKIIDLVNWELLTQQPKWLVGYSDVTAIHQHANNLGVQTLHATMPIHLAETDEESILSFHAMIEALKGESIEYYLESDMEEHKPIKGEIVGGNLSVLYSLMGSNSEMNWDNKILFLEDLDEYLYHIDRMMNAFSRAGKLSALKALLVGSFKDMHDNTIPFGADAEEIVQHYGKKYKIPVFYGMPCGHEKLNIPVICGAKVIIENFAMRYA